MGDAANGYDVIPTNLTKAVQSCADQRQPVKDCIAGFGPARLTKRDFSQAPQADELAASYVDGTQEMNFEDKRYDSVVAYLNDLHDALQWLADSLDASAYNYTFADLANQGKATP
ncbi:hypothetical protein GCM10010149_86310 [Nonomuraea roseoviolacea subsp. roseoviolacea]|uniref:PE domain-containing protein n=1 Tax=Nonomuraea roseoviolacea subsp. carminata TaxID=160689 RepID=A0ABT1JX00_9ACTN|nr:hypothetical protein [Nonomuraea roseoviolacea]MCP2345942.1 hypothetical protein [Nonomuraea roseoviolacea subsp. carminata]